LHRRMRKHRPLPVCAAHQNPLRSPSCAYGTVGVTNDGSLTATFLRVTQPPHTRYHSFDVSTHAMYHCDRVHGVPYTSTCSDSGRDGCMPLARRGYCCMPDIVRATSQSSVKMVPGRFYPPHNYSACFILAAGTFAKSRVGGGGPATPPGGPWSKISYLSTSGNLWGIQYVRMHVHESAHC